MLEAYDPNTIGTPCCPSKAGVLSWQHEADRSYEKGVWECVVCTSKKANDLVKKDVLSTGGAGNMN